MRLPKNEVFRPVVAHYVLHHTEFCVSKAHICWLACQTAAPVEVNADFINLIQTRTRKPNLVFGFRKSNLVVLLQRPILGLGDSYFMYLTVNFD